jgi:hypothetical protein
VVRGPFELSQFDEIIREVKLGVVILGISAQGRLQIAARTRAVPHLEEGDSQRRSRRRHFRV